MAIYLLDTNHASPLITPSHTLRHRVITEIAAGATFAICVPMVTELIFGIGLLPRAVANRTDPTLISLLFA